MPFWVTGLAAYAVWIAIGWTLKEVSFKYLRHLTSKTETQWDDAVIGAANIPLTLMILVWGAAFVIHYVVHGVPPRALNAVTLFSKVATLAAVVLFIDLLLVNAWKVYSMGNIVLMASQAFSTAVIHVVVLSIGALVILDSLGISITPIIASLGIGSLAVALALQPTLENIFSGFQILMDQPVLPGHFIRLESGEEGIVEKIGWRTSWIRQLPNNMIIIPNKQLVNGRVMNYNYPSKDLAVTIEIGVHYNSDLEKVERVVLDVAKTILRTVPGGFPGFDPLVRFHTFADSSINFTAILRANDVTDIGLLKHEFIKALSKRFADEKIVIPYPVRALNTTQEQAILSRN